MNIYRLGQDYRGVLTKATWLPQLDQAVAHLFELKQEISITLVSAVVSRRLNRIYRGKDKATDVLSFRLAENKKSAVLGELIICYPVIVRQAREHKHSIQRELAIMTIHGTLHLLGHDHEKQAQAKRMEKQERLLLAELSTLR